MSLGPAAYVFAAVLAYRLLLLLRLTDSASLLPTGSDMQFYDAWATRITQGEFTDHHAFYGLPLYPYLLAVLFKCFGHNVFAPALLQIVCDSGTAALIYKISVSCLRDLDSIAGVGNVRLRSLSGANGWIIGVLGAGAWAGFVPAEAYSIVLMPTALGVFGFWLVVWSIVDTQCIFRLWKCLGLGIWIGLLATGSAIILSVTPLLLAAVFLKSEKLTPGFRSWMRIRSAALLVVGIGVGSAPCWLHNSFVAKDAVFLSAHGGINFWLGNNPEANGYPHFPAPLRTSQSEMLRDSITIAESAAGRALKTSEVSAYWSAKARAFIRAQPVAWLKLLGVKLRNFWSAFEYDDVGVIDRLREEAVIPPGLHFGLLAALAIPGICFAVVAFPVSRWVAAALLVQIFAILPVFVTERYRLPVVPGLAIFAAFGLGFMWWSIARLRVRQSAIFLLLVLGGIAIVSGHSSDPAVWALRFYNTGVRAFDRGDLESAGANLQRAYAYAPGSAELNVALGNLHMARHDPAAAAHSYHDALRVQPENVRALTNLATLYLEASAWSPAETLLHQALVENAQNAKLHYLLARALAGRGDYVAAQSEVARALEIAPQQPNFLALQDEIKRDASNAPVVTQP